MKFDKIKGYIKNEEVIKNAFYSVLGLIPFIIFAVYVLFFSDFDFDSSVSTKTVGIISIITLIGVRIYRYIARRLGKTNGLKSNSKLEDLEENIDGIEFELNDDTYGIIAVNEINKEKQNNRNIVLTQVTIAKLENQKRKLNKKHKEDKVIEIEKEIEYLRENKLFDNTFEPFDYYKFENAKAKADSKPIDGSNVHKEIEDQGKLLSWVINVATAIFGGTVGLGVAVGLPGAIIFWSLVSLVISMGLTFLLNYSMVYIKVNTKEYYRNRQQIYQIKKNIYDRVQELKNKKIIKKNEVEEKTDAYIQPILKMKRDLTKEEKERFDKFFNKKGDSEMTKEEKQIIEDFCGPCIYYGDACAGLPKAELSKGILECEDQNYKKEGE